MKRYYSWLWAAFLGLLALSMAIAFACSNGGGSDDDDSGDGDDDNDNDSSCYSCDKTWECASAFGDGWACQGDCCVEVGGDDDDDDNDNDDNDDVDDDDDNDDDDNDDDDDFFPTTPGFIRILHGSFTMGSPLDEPGREMDEIRHKVTLTNDFELSIYETTQVKFGTRMGWNPSYFGPNGEGAACGNDCPVENVSWYDSLAYANEFSLDAGYTPCYTFANVVCEDSTNVGTTYLDCMNTEQQGIASATMALNGVTSVYDCEGYRLPTESEWEYSVRAGTTSAFYNGAITYCNCQPLDPNLDAVGWYCGNDDSTTMVVGQKNPNAWGLYDLSGNVLEWIWDWYGIYPGVVTDPQGPVSGLYRVIRGGSWTRDARSCRSAVRSSDFSSDRNEAIGFRLVRSLP